MLAAQHGHLSTVKFLIEDADANINAKTAGTAQQPAGWSGT